METPLHHWNKLRKPVYSHITSFQLVYHTLLAEVCQATKDHTAPDIIVVNNSELNNHFFDCQGLENLNKVRDVIAFWTDS